MKHNATSWSAGELLHVEVFTTRNSGEAHRNGWSKNTAVSPRLYPRRVRAGSTDCLVWMLVVRKKVVSKEGAA